MKTRVVFAVCIGAVLACLLMTTGCQDTYTTSAKVYMQQNNYDKAIEQCLLAVEQIPNNHEAYYVLGQAYGAKGMYREMTDAFTKALAISQIHALDIQNHRERFYSEAINSGVSKTREQKFEEAADKFLISTEILPNKFLGYKNLLISYTQLNRDSDAVATYKKAVQVDSTDMEIRVFMGVQFYYNKKRYEECVATLLPVLKKANPQSKHYSEAIKYAAFSYDLLGKTDMALEAYQNALKQSPDNMDFIFNLGRVYAMKNDYEKSLECFQKVLQSQPNDFDANLQMGYLNFQAKKFKDAVTYFEKTTQIQPDNPDGWDGLYRTYANLGDKAKATEAFEKTEALKKAKGQ